MKSTIPNLSGGPLAPLLRGSVIVSMKVKKFLAHGERLGLIRFGSLRDIYVDPTSQIDVKLGDMVQTGKTKLGELPLT